MASASRGDFVLAFEMSSDIALGLNKDIVEDLLDIFPSAYGCDVKVMPVEFYV